MRRRAFLQQTGLALATWGASGSLLWQYSDRYQQVLAAPTGRKLALLVGINQYAASDHLTGCVTDVELQRELLVARFGFQPEDVLLLTDQKATRQAIVTAFTEHLMPSVRPNDVVVFHFSGYGSNLTLGDVNKSSHNSLVVADDAVTGGDVPLVNDLLEATLWLLLRSLPTDKVVAVFDTGYTYPGTSLQGNLRVRAKLNPSTAQPIAAELALQEQLWTQLIANRRTSATRSELASQPPGLVLAATGDGQVALEAKWQGFSAGLFTYALTQTLWQATPATTLQTSFRRTAEQVRRRVSQQQPELKGQKSQDATRLPYPPSQLITSGVDGVVEAVEEGGRVARLWLGGLPAAVLEQYGTNSLLQLAEPLAGEPSPPTLLQITSREGLVAKARICCASNELEADSFPLQAGQWVREQVRVLPRNVGLTVAIDHTLERIERVDAISALSAIPHVSSAIAGEQPADYLFSKLQNQELTQVAALPSAAIASTTTPANISANGYGLFSSGRDTISSTAGERGEAVKVAIKRLAPTLQTLLAAKLLNLTVNEATSQLGVRVTLETLTPEPRSLVQQETSRAANIPSSSKESLLGRAAPAEPGRINLTIGNRIRYRVENFSPSPLYMLLLGLDNSGAFFYLNPFDPQVADPATAEHIAVGTTLILPATTSPFQWMLRHPAGLSENYLIFSQAPFTQTLATLATGIRPSPDSPALNVVVNPLDVAQAVLQDLHQANGATTYPIPVPPDSVALDVNVWATLRFAYQVG
ncbi:caspase family protein [Pantanalinema rosaneae CENA516]|uniref:caspase family protein n=1 Tax=Pantanalinema rosaneae TaxID=1620701 RepID=UPI003D6F5E94